MKRTFWQHGPGGRLIEVEVIDRRPAIARGNKNVRDLLSYYKRRVRKRVIDVPYEVVELGTRPIGSKARFSRGDASRGSKARRR